MRSRGSFVRIQSVEEVRASLATFGAGVAQRLDQRRAEPVEGETAFSYQQVFDDFDRELETIHTVLVTAEDERVRKRIQVSRSARLGEQLTEALYDRQVAVRRTLAGIYGPDRGFEVAAVEGKTPRTLKGIADQVDVTVRLLRQPEVELPTLEVDGVVVDLGTMAGRLETELADLQDLGVRLERARKAAGESVVVRKQAIEEFDGVFPWVARALESLFRLVGETDLAERIRTSVRRVTRRQADEPEKADGAAGEDSGESASDAESSGATQSNDARSKDPAPEEAASSDSGAAEPAASSGSRR